MSISHQYWPALDEEARRQAWRFRCFYFLVGVAATPRAAILYLVMYLRAPDAFIWFRDSLLTPWRAVRDISTARLVRKIQLVTGWTATPVIVWPKNVPNRCVLAYFHTNWDMIISCEYARRNWCLMRTHEDWAKRLGPQYIDWSKSPRVLIRKINEGERVGVALDTSVHVTAPVADVPMELSLFPFRVAELTDTPVVPIYAVYEHGMLRLVAGKSIDVSEDDAEYRQALSEAAQFFGHALRRDPASFRKIIPYLMRVGEF